MRTSRTSHADQVQTVRQSVTFPLDVHQMLEKIAHEKKVSLAWVVRDAVDQYVSAQWPLFGQQLQQGESKDR